MPTLLNPADEATARVIQLYSDDKTESAELVAFADLYLSDLNPRSVVDEDSIIALAENMRKCGMIQNLAGLRDEAGKTAIVAGGRRLRALGLLQDDPRFRWVPVKIAPDAETAFYWATSENHQREQPNPADEVREYGAMRKRGITVPEIALAFGVSEQQVHRRLALVGLADPILAALKAGEISLGVAAAFTIANDEALTMEVLTKVRGNGRFGASDVRRMLKPDAVRASDRRARFVGEDAYQAAGGRITRDLFSDEVIYDDAEVLETVFQEKLTAEADALGEAEGWNWVEFSQQSYIGWHDIETRRCDRLYPISGDLSEEDSERYDELAELANGEALDEAGEADLAVLQAILNGDFSGEQKALSGVLIYVREDGSLGRESGLVKPEDKKAAIAAGLLQESAHGSTNANAVKPLFSAALSDDLKRVATGARQHAALRDPDLVLALLAFDLSGRMGYRHAFGLRKEDVPNLPTTKAAGYALDPRLTTAAPAPKDPWDSDLARAFKEFRKKGAAHVTEELVRHLAGLLTLGDAKLAALVDKAVTASVREVWTPTAANFFGRVGGPYLNELWRDLLGLKPDHPTVTTFAKLKKVDKVAKLESLFSDPAFRAAMGLTPETEAKIAAWLPETLA